MMITTKTLAIDSMNPEISFCEGHVSARIFTKAFNREGLCPGVRISESDIEHEYWVETKAGWRRSSPKNLNAIPVTVMYW